MTHSRIFSVLILLTAFLGGATAPVTAQHYAPGRILNGKDLERNADRFFSAVYDGSWRVIRDEFSLTGDMQKQYREWMADNGFTASIQAPFGELGELRETRIVQDLGSSRSVELYYPGSRCPLKGTVTYIDEKVAEVRWEKWQGGPWPWMTQLIVGYLCALPVLGFLIIFIGEKWRAAYLHRRNLRRLAYEQDVSPEETYRQRQNPLWVYVLTLLLGSPFLVLPYEPLYGQTFVPPEVRQNFCWGFLAVLGVSLLLTGFRVRVNRHDVVVGMGCFRVPVLRIPLEKITGVHVIPFRPMREFHGWGIRRSRDGIWGYFMSGHLGVLIETVDDKRYLLGSDTPDRLAEAIAVRTKKK